MPRLLSVVLCALLACRAHSLTQPHEDHSLPGWNGEAEGRGGDAPNSMDEWSGEIVQLSWHPRAYLLKSFLTDEECDHIIAKAEPAMKKSSVADNKTGKSFESKIRTSSGTFFAKKQDEVIARIEKRVAQVTMVPEENQEAMQVLHYIDGQKYEPHHDYFHDQYNQAKERGGQRLVTVLMYLSTPDDGGETVFPSASPKVTGDEWSDCAKRGLAVKAEKGNALMFFALHPDGTEDPTSLHGSCPTTKGNKWSATKWIHVNAHGMPVSVKKAKWEGKDVTSADACIDENESCSGWAAMSECDNNPAYMQRHCRKSCGRC